MERTSSIPYRVRPHDLRDIVVGVSMCSFQGAIYFVLPALLVGWLTENTGLGILAFATYLLFVAHSVWGLEVDDHGLRFDRWLGQPKTIAWGAITHVEAVSPNELIRHGWLWPMFPPGDMTTCLSSHGFYRIDWQVKSVYYPPKDTALFEREVVARVRADVEG